MISRVFKKKFIIVLILVLGFLLRIIAINDSPPALYGDELTIALDSNSLLKTGQDQLGNSFPLTFQMGAGRPAGYVYGSIPFIALFGTTSLGVRSLSVLSGVGIIILLYLLGKKLFSEKVGLYSALIASLSAWDISLSRIGFEAHFALFLALLGTVLFLKAKDKPVLYIFSAISFGVVLHTYPTYKLSLIFFLPLLFWFQGWKHFFNVKKYFLAGLGLFIIIGAIALSQTFIGGSEKRFSEINIFAKENLKSEIEQKINFERTVTNLPQPIAKYFHNTLIEYAKIYIEYYLQNFSMDFLILHGDRNPRHNMSTMGQLYLAELILVFVGIISLWQKNRKVFMFIISWLMIAPIPSAFVDLPHALRSSLMLPALTVLSGYGLSELIANKKRMWLPILGVIFIVQFVFFIQKLYFLAPNEYNGFWSYPAKVASNLAIENKDKYKYIVISDNIDSIEFAYPVYDMVDPSLVISQNKKSSELNGLRFKKYDNVYIGHIPEGETDNFIDQLNESVLLISSPGAINYIKNYETVYGFDNSALLVIKKAY